MLLPKNCHFAGCEIETVCLKTSLLVVREVFARQILSEESEIVGEMDGQAPENFLKSAIAKTGARKKKLL